MYISRLDMLHVRSFNHATINFSPNINIIIGPNNSGKSTILKCLLKLQKPNLNIVSSDIRKPSHIAKLHMQLEMKNGELLFHKGNANKSRYEEMPIRVVFSITKENNESRFAVMNDTIIESSQYRMLVEPTHTLREFLGLFDTEEEESYIYPFLAKRKVQFYSSNNDYSTTFSIEEDFRNLPAKIKKLSHPSHPSNKEFVEYCEKILGFNIGDVPSDNNQTKLGIYITDRDIVYLESMGEGVANVIGLLAILLTEDNKVFIIEELENDIHPQSLKYLLELITKKSTNNQFIISTHSNIVLKYLASIEHSKIFYTSSTFMKEGRINIPTSTIEEIENTPEKRLDILERLGYELFDFDLYSAYIILEQSSAEQVIKELLIPVFVPELLNKIKTISAGGVTKLETRFDDFLRLFVYIHTNSIYNKKAWVIADGDGPGIEHINKLKEKFTTWDSEHFINFTKDNFEEYYPEPFLSKYKEIEQKQSKDERRKAKAELTKEVVEYIRSNREKAKQEFKKSAKDVIDVLKAIAEKLKQTA